MILHLSQAFFNMTNQEDGYVPGEAMTTAELFITFVAVPTVLFLVIALVAHISTGGLSKKSSKSSSITSIE